MASKNNTLEQIIAAMTAAGTQPDPRTQTNNAATFEQLLQLLSGKYGSGDDIISYLNGLGITDFKALDMSQRQDWNKQILDTLLNQLLTNENRAYNESMRDEQRSYDSPIAQLARLMGTGMSRDAALAALQGGQQPIGSDPAAAGQGLPASQSSLNQAQSVGQVFGNIANIATSIYSLGSFGISASLLDTNKKAIEAATAGQVLTNTQMKKTLQGVESASTVIGMLSTAVDDGFLSPDHEFSSSHDMLNYIRENQDKYEPFKDFVISGQADFIGKDLYALNALNAGYKSWRESRDYGIDRKQLVSQYALDLLYKSIDIEKVQSEIAQNYQAIDESIANVINSTRVAQSQVVLNNSLAGQADANKDLLTQQYELGQFDLDWLNANINDLNSVRTTQLMLDAARWNALQSDPKALQADIDSWLEDRQNVRTAIAIESFYYNNRLSATSQLASTSIPLSDHNFAQMACWFHNMFSQTPMPRPGSASQYERDVLGDLSASQIALWALRKYARVP